MLPPADVGRRGESLAAEYLRGEGFELCERGWRSGHLEVDLIALKDGVMHFVEVKTRCNDQRWDDDFSPERAMDQAKLQRIVRAANDYVLDTGFDGELSVDHISINITTDGVRYALRYYPGVQW